MLSKNKIVLATGLLALFGAMNAAQAALDCTSAATIKAAKDTNPTTAEVNACALDIQVLKDKAPVSVNLPLANAMGVALAVLTANIPKLSETSAKLLGGDDAKAKLAANEFNKLIKSSPEAAKTVAAAVSKIVVENPTAVTKDNKVKKDSVVEGLIASVIKVDPKILEKAQTVEKVKQEKVIEAVKNIAEKDRTAKQKADLLAAETKLAAVNVTVKAVKTNPNLTKATKEAKLATGAVERFGQILKGDVVKQVAAFKGNIDQTVAQRTPKGTLANNVFIIDEAAAVSTYLANVSKEGTVVNFSLEADETPLNTCKKPMVFGMFPVSACAPRSKTDVAFGK